MTNVVAAIVLQVVVAGSMQTISVSALEKHIPSVTIMLFNPVYKRSLTYQGFWLEQVLAAMRVSLKDRDIVFLSADGYGTSLSKGEVGKKKWLLAYGEPNGWTPLPAHDPPLSPGPWYLVGRTAQSYQATPWPYQIETIKIRKDW